MLENYNKGKTALLSAAKVMVSPTEVDLTPELIFQQQPLPTGPPVPAGLALGLPAADHRNSSVRSAPPPRSPAPEGVCRGHARAFSAQMLVHVWILWTRRALVRSRHSVHVHGRD